jgi:hypothetical protein
VTFVLPVLAAVWLVVVLRVMYRRLGSTRHGRIAVLGFGLAMVGGFLTPGVFYGEYAGRTVMDLVSTVIFWVGMGLLVWALVLWRRSRRAAA